MEASIKSAIYIASYVLPFVALVAMAIWLRQAAYPEETQVDPACIGLYDDAAALQGLESIEDVRREAIDRMLAVRGRCISEPYFLDTLSRVMIEAGRAAEWRDLLASPEITAVLRPEVIELHVARTQIAEADQQAHAGAEAQAAVLRKQAMATAVSLMQRWTDWQEAYALADLAEGGGGQRFEQQFLARSARFDPALWVELNAAMSWLIAIATVFAGLAALGMAYRAWTGARQLDTPISAIALAPPGFAALRGTVHVPPGLPAKAHPANGVSCAWYFVRHGKRQLRSAQPVMLRDASGTLLLDLDDADVRPGHHDVDHVLSNFEHLVEQIAGQGRATVAAKALDRALTSKRDRNYLVEGERVTVYGALTGEPNQTRSLKRHDRPVLVLGGDLEDTRAELRSAQRWGLLLGVPLLALCGWIVRQMTHTGFSSGG